MSARKNWVTGLIVGGLVGFAIYKLLKLRRDERPPIRVRGGSISFETDSGWKEVPKADEWMQDLDHPPAVADFIVAIHKGASTKVQEGNIVQFNPGPGLRSLTIDSDGEPKLHPRSRLPKDTGSGHGPVKDPHNRLNRIHVIGNDPEDLDEGDWIKVTFNRREEG